MSSTRGLTPSRDDVREVFKLFKPKKKKKSKRKERQIQITLPSSTEANSIEVRGNRQAKVTSLEPSTPRPRTPLPPRKRLHSELESENEDEDDVEVRESELAKELEDSLDASATATLSRATSRLSSAHGRHLSTLSGLAATAERRLHEQSRTERALNSPLEDEPLINFVRKGNTGELLERNAVPSLNPSTATLGEVPSSSSGLATGLDPADGAKAAHSRPVESLEASSKVQSGARALSETPVETLGQPPSAASIIAAHVADIQASSVRLAALWHERALLEEEEREVVKELDELVRQRDAQERGKELAMLLQRVEMLVEESSRGVQEQEGKLIEEEKVKG